ncbi:hypothetical protein K1W54_06940 [Micromonospora sp. CPCC 205371]|nr:hypothetical protein [Micromonospora sp. CPCC 205371]
MGLQHETTLAGHARAAVDLKIRMAEYTDTTWFTEYLRTWLEVRFTKGDKPAPPVTDNTVTDFSRFATTVWRTGESYVVAPAMTAIVAAAASALDLTGEIITEDVAPTHAGVLFLPEPVYQRDPEGRIHSLGAITWSRVPPVPELGRATASWIVAGWADLGDPHDPASTEIRRDIAHDRRIAARFGPYLLVDWDMLTIGAPVHGVNWLPTDGDRDWHNAPDGRYVIDTAAADTFVCSRLAYAFWRISAQPLAAVAKPPLDRPARRRATRASIVHDTRVVMLRRTSTITEPGDGDAKWHYRVRFAVRGHWRRLHDKNGQPYRIWIHAYIKGPDGAPLLHGEKVAVLAR